MTRNILLYLAIGSLMACATNPSDPGDDGTGSGSDPGTGSGSDPGDPTKVVLNGSAVSEGQSGSSALSGTAITIYKISDNSTVGTAMSDAMGKFTITIDAPSCDCYAKASKSSYADTYVYPVAPWTGVTKLETSQLGSSTFSLLNTFAGGDSSKGLIIATVQKADGSPVAGAKIVSQPASGSYKYSDGSGQPSGSTSTSSDGIAFFMSAPVGSVQLAANKSGMTFKQHAVTTHAGALVTTGISE